jgi:hypothetical protein
MALRKPIEVPTDDLGRVAFAAGASREEWQEYCRTYVMTVSMRVKWWWRRFERTLR